MPVRSLKRCARMNEIGQGCTYVWGSGYRVQGSGFRVQGAGFRVQRFGG
jgi:hypothetical protein